MFEQLGSRLKGALDRLGGRGRLTEANISDALREVRMSLLEADVALPVAKQFVEDVKQRAVGQEVLKSLNPGQTVIKVVHEELTRLMGESNERLNLAARPPVVVLLAGLQGAGKTTTAAKLARYLQQREKKSVMLVSVDVYRPAAIDQLEKLANEVGAVFFPSNPDQNPVDIASNAYEAARKKAIDVVIVDSAGRLHVDADMMDEIQRVHAAINPVETLFVADSMTGQDAVKSSAAFNDALPLTGVILTKTDGDARGGAALTIRALTGKPIKFLGTGEKIDGLEAFHPERLASRILGMGDVLSLIEETQHKVDQAEAEKLAKKLKKGKGFDLTDLRDQLEQVSKMGGMASLMDKMPGMGNVPESVKAQVNDKENSKMIAIINSMTPHERRRPLIIKAKRKQRIAAGSGTQVQDVNKLLKQFTQMQKMMKKMKGGGMARMMRGMGKMPGMPF